MKKLWKAQASLILLAVLSVGMCASAFADGPNLPKYSDEEYSKLKKEQAESYWKQIDDELKKWKTSATDYAQKVTATQAEIDKLTAEIKEVEAQIVKYELICLDKEISKMEKMTWDDQKANEAKIAGYEARLKDIKGLNGADQPENKSKIAELEGRLAKLKEGLQLPGTWTVQKGEYLYKIAGYPQIYGDPLKWPRIYRANRDLIKDPNLIYPGWVLKIPRGLITSWTVYKGETLAKIAGYQEVYNKRGEWTKIYEANKDQVKDPNAIYPKQTLTIPR